MREWPQRPHSFTCGDRGRHCGEQTRRIAHVLLPAVIAGDAENKKSQYYFRNIGFYIIQSLLAWRCRRSHLVIKRRLHP